MAHYIIPPSIDPLSEKNKELSTQQAKNVFEKLGIPQDRPMLLQAKNPSYAREMGEAGRGVVKDKFLITRHLKDYLRLIGELCS